MQRALFRTRIKFCGLTRGRHPPGRRVGRGCRRPGVRPAQQAPVEPASARALRDAMAPLVDVVALFMDNPVDEVREAIAQVRPSLLQFHGSEDDAFCRRFGLPYLKGIGMRGHEAALVGGMLHARFPNAAGFVLDGHGPVRPVAAASASTCPRSRRTRPNHGCWRVGWSRQRVCRGAYLALGRGCIQRDRGAARRQGWRR